MRAVQIRACAAVLVIVAAGCGNSNGAADMAGVDMTPIGTPHPNGLDSRPANPTCIAPARPVQQAAVRLETPFPNLPASNFPALLELRQAPGNPGFFHAALRGGTIKKFPNRPDAMPNEISDYIVLGGRVNAGPDEAGLLGMAFHPDFASNKYVYLSYSAPSGTSPANLRSTVGRFVERTDGTLDPATGAETKVFPPADNAPNLDDKYGNHNGGGINFGPDGMLYYALGDGGLGGDPDDNAENVNSPWGKILRVDVNISMGEKYRIPPTNPFAGGGGLPEIFAWGLRNPWRFSFDRDTGELWAGDVGQGAWEEIDLIKLGGNYGWDIREGAHCYEPMNNCRTAGLIDPAVEYSHGGGRCSIVGGYVYRGKAMPELVGTYYYSDTCSGELFAIGYDQDGKPQHTRILDAGISTYSFAEDADGELYMLGGGGEIRKIVPSGPVVPDTFPKMLSQTGCADPADPKKPTRGLIPYIVNAPLWSDGSEKQRWLAVPDGQTIDIEADGDLTLPSGSVLVKTFLVGGKRVETRLFMRHSDGGWAGYSYEWNDAETDATLLPAGKVSAVGGQTWTFPSRAECLRCHTDAAGRTLGLEIGQLNRDLVYLETLRRSNQVATFNHIGLFTRPAGDPMTLVAYPDPLGAAPADERARAYLHANCSYCHRMGGTGQGMQDFRFALDFRAQMLCNVDPREGDLGVSGAKLIAPGDPERSIMSLRMRALDAKRMPPLASGIVDESAVGAIDEWIRSITQCP